MAIPPVSKLDEQPVAGLARRLAAMVYDALLVAAVWLVTIFALTAANHFQAVSGAWFQTILFLQAFGFFAFFWLRDGQTLGMRAWRLRLIANNGRDLTLNQVTIRWMTALISLVALGLGYWWCLVDERRRTWPDLASDSSIVVDAPYADEI